MIDLSKYKILFEGARAAYYYHSESIANYCYIPDPAWPINTIAIIQHKDAKWRIYLAVKNEKHFEDILQKYINDKTRLKKLETDTGNITKRFLEQVSTHAVSKLSSEDLTDLLQFYYETNQDLQRLAMTLRLLDRAVLLYLRSYFTDSADEKISILSASHRKTFSLQEHLALLNMVVGKKKNASQLKKISDTYSLLTLGYLDEKPKSEGDYKYQIDELLENNPAKLLKNLREKDTRDVAARNKQLKTMKGDAAYVGSLVGEIGYLKDYYKFSINRVQLAAEPIFTEIAKRSGVSVHEIKNVSHQDATDIVNSKSYDKKLASTRLRHTIFVSLTGKVHETYIGDEADEFEKKYLTFNSTAIEQIFKGRTACQGYVEGIAKIVYLPSDFHKVTNGDIIVVLNTSPDFVPIFSKISAIVAEEGGLTSHVSVISREMSIPCVVGIHNITIMVHDGDRLIVDATKGIVEVVDKREEHKITKFI